MLASTITLVGNLTADPEVRSTTSGTAVANVRVAVNKRVFNKDTKEWEDGPATYWRCAAFGDLATHIKNSLAKGNRVLIHGEVRDVSWDDKETNIKRTDKELVIDEIGPSLTFTDVTVGGRRQEAVAEQVDEWSNVDSDTTF